MRIRLPNLLPMLLILSLSYGCMPSRNSSITMPLQNEAPDEASAQLALAASSISESLSELRGMSSTRITPQSKYLALPHTNKDFSSLATIDWSGPLDSLLRRLGEMHDYKVKILGRAPAVPILISIKAKNTPIQQIIRDADFQAGSRASIFIYPAIKLIELRYSNI